MPLPRGSIVILAALAGCFASLTDRSESTDGGSETGGSDGTTAGSGGSATATATGSTTAGSGSSSGTESSGSGTTGSGTTGSGSSTTSSTTGTTTGEDDSSSEDGGEGTTGAGEGCRSQTDCDAGGGFCNPPGTPPPCGACVQPDPGTVCTVDEDCLLGGTGRICEPLRCACGGESTCVPGCTTDPECEPWQFCAPDGRCLADVCLNPEDCPPNFACTGSASPHCARKSCELDGECDGYCVQGQCHDALGTCDLPPP